MGHRVDVALLTLSNLLIPAAVLIFAAGFFPYKPFLPGLAEYDSVEYGEYEDPPEPPFDKLVFMVVDALRSDFVYSSDSGFEFTQSLISSGAALPFTAHATSPTITMPRVKAMTTGSIPSFLDVILNFAESDTTATLAQQDTWLAQIKAKGERLVMYGDDTWLKLFPGTFTRADGTSSFFVSDFTEVDHNVTRHIPDELRRSDWTAMIMHYLGLDHIGHKAGPNSPNMLPKQREMDAIVEQIYTAIEKESHLQSTLFVLCGDHGMNEGGNHGGSAPGETSPALVFMSPKLKRISKGRECPTTPSDDFDYYDKVEQSDIAPTLAGLLGFPVPLNNLGVFIPDFLRLFDNEHDRVQLLLRNALQMLNVVKATFSNPSFDNPFAEIDCRSPSATGDVLACKWEDVTNIFKASGAQFPPQQQIMSALTKFCQASQDAMSSTASNYDVRRLVQGILAASASVALALFSLRSCAEVATPAGGGFAIVTILYGIMMFASSYVEEEQHFWYWTTSAWLGYLYISEAQKRASKSFLGLSTFSCAVCLLLHRICQRWNQTGQKHAGAPDLVQLLVRHPIILWLLVGATYLTFTWRLQSRFSRFLSKEMELLGISAAASVTMTSFAFKLCFTARDAPELVGWVPERLQEALEDAALVPMARVVFWGVGVGLAWVVIDARRHGKKMAKNAAAASNELAEGIHDLVSLFLVTQTRAPNIPLFLGFHIQKSLLSRLRLSTTQTSLTTLLLAHTSFFALANSNAISSIDLSNAYNGVSGYNVVGVGILVFVSNWAGPIWWSSASVLLLAQDRNAPHAEDETTVDGGKKTRQWVDDERESLRQAASSGTSSAKEEANRKAFSANSQHPSPMFLHVGLLTMFMSFALLAVMAACTALRTHLFIWTVFSPKYLFAMTWSMAFHLGISVGVGNLLWMARGM